MIKEYKCPKCNETKEIIIIRKDQDIIPECTKCKLAMQLVDFSLSSFRLKGNDWYKPSYD